MDKLAQGSFISTFLRLFLVCCLSDFLVLSAQDRSALLNTPNAYKRASFSQQRLDGDRFQYRRHGGSFVSGTPIGGALQQRAQYLPGAQIPPGMQMQPNPAMMGNQMQGNPMMGMQANPMGMQANPMGMQANPVGMQGNSMYPAFPPLPLASLLPPLYPEDATGSQQLQQAPGIQQGNVPSLGAPQQAIPQQQPGLYQQANLETPPRAPSESDPTLYHLIRKNLLTESFAGMIDTVKIRAALVYTKNVTLLAPMDTAFQRISGEILDRLNQETETLRAIALYHILVGVHTTTDIMAAGPDGLNVRTALGPTVHLVYDEATTEFVVNGVATLRKKNTMASNGVLHLLDALLIPSPESVAEVHGPSPSPSTTTPPPPTSSTSASSSTSPPEEGDSATTTPPVE